MDKVVSTRMDEAMVALLDSLAQSLGKPKKRILEEALKRYADSLEEQSRVLDDTCGAWSRRASADEIRRQIRAEFERSMGRRHS
jgi:predicted DNA-binding protein